MIAENRVPKLISGAPLGIDIYSVTCEKAHHHEGILEIIYCLKGTVNIAVSYEDLSIGEGQIFSCDQHDIHFLSASEENLLVSFYLDLNSPVFDYPDLSSLFFVCQEDVISQERQAQLPQLKLLLLTALYYHCFPSILTDPTSSFQDLCKKIMDVLVTHFHFFHYAVYYMNNPKEHTQEAKDRFARIMVYVNKHYKEKLTIAQLSEIEHLNPNYLSHFFKETAFMGFPNYVNFVRVYESELLLLTTHKSISHIAYEVGFSDPKFYYKTFKLWYHRTPLQHKKYREQLQTNIKENVYFPPASDLPRMEHYIARYFALLQQKG